MFYALNKIEPDAGSGAVGDEKWALCILHDLTVPCTLALNRARGISSVYLDCSHIVHSPQYSDVVLRLSCRQQFGAVSAACLCAAQDLLVAGFAHSAEMACGVLWQGTSVERAPSGETMITIELYYYPTIVKSSPGAAIVNAASTSVCVFGHTEFISRP